MPFPLVKCSPWDKGKRRRAKGRVLWDEKFWKALVRQAAEDQRATSSRCMSRLVLVMIGDMNRKLYG